MNTIPFDFVDSSSWKQQSIYGIIDKKKVSKDFSKQNRWKVMLENHKKSMQMQEYYYNKWKKICKD